jgi:hypothetical protein
MNESSSTSKTNDSPLFTFIISVELVDVHLNKSYSITKCQDVDIYLAFDYFQFNTIVIIVPIDHILFSFLSNQIYWSTGRSSVKVNSLETFQGIDGRFAAAFHLGCRWLGLMVDCYSFIWHVYKRNELCRRLFMFDVQLLLRYS